MNRVVGIVYGNLAFAYFSPIIRNSLYRMDQKSYSSLLLIILIFRCYLYLIQYQKTEIRKIEYFLVVFSLVFFDFAEKDDH